MKFIGISEFKARCISILKDVQASQTSLIVTHRGRPIARIEPLGAAGPRRLGALRHLGKICGDLVGSEFAEEWEMERE